jgi:hypothetical protein
VGVVVAVTVPVIVAVMADVFFRLRLRMLPPGVRLGVKTGVLVIIVIVPVGVSVGVSVIVMVPVAVLVAVVVRIPVEVALIAPKTVVVTLGVRVTPAGVVPFGVTLPADRELDASVPGPKGAAGAEVPPQERLMNKQGARTRTAMRITCNEDLLTSPPA